MTAPRYLCVLGVAALLLAPNAQANSEAINALTEQAQFWQQQQDLVRAKSAWQRLLEAQPEHPEALYWLGLIALEENDRTQAQRFLTRLRAQSAASARADQLDQLLVQKQSGQSTNLLAQARAHAKAGEFAKAVALMRPMFGATAPQGALAAEFYEYLGYTEQGAQEARQGLARLTQQQPTEARWALVYAELLTRNAQTRTQGIEALERLAKHPQMGAQAQQAWQQALRWNGAPNAKTVPLFERYAEHYPDDNAVKQQLAQYRNRPRAAAQSAPAPSPLAGAFKALEANHLSQAERLFNNRLAQAPSDRDALGGLGVVRQKQQRLEEAQALLARAVSGRAQSPWRNAYHEVQFWQAQQQAERAAAEENWPQAQQYLQQALRLKPSAPQSLQLQADGLVRQGRYAEAEALYRRVLAANVAPGTARVRLISVLAQQNKQEEAEQELAKLSAGERAELKGLGALRANQALARAKTALSRGDQVAGSRALDEALRHDPNNVWVRFELARLYQRQGEPEQARELMNGLLQARPQDSEVLYAAALLAVEASDWARAEQLLTQLPKEVREPKIRELIDEVAFQRRMQDVDALHASARHAEAVTLLARVEALAVNHPERQARVAQAYAANKEPQRAIFLMRELLAASPRQDDGLTISYAAVLLEAEQEVEAAALLRDLQHRALGVYDRERYDDLVFGYRVRQAERLREKGDLVGAYDTLAPALTARPQDPAVVGALARMYGDNNQHDKALALYRGAIRRNPTDPLLAVAAAQQASRAQLHGEANRYLEQALSRAPDNPQVLLAAAEAYRAQGRSAKAAQLLRKIVAQERHSGKPLAVSSNPFALAAEQALAQIPEPVQAQEEFAEWFDEGRPRTALSPDNPFARPAGMAANDPYQGMSEAARALNEIGEQRSASVTQGVLVSSNDNDAGVGKLTAIQAPLEINLPVGENRVAIRLTPVHVNGGEPEGEARTRYGSGVLSSAQHISPMENLLYWQIAPERENWQAAQNQLYQTASPGKQSDSGLGVSLAWQHAPTGLKADVGLTPRGFLYQQVVGGVGIERPLAGGSMSYGAELTRRMITDSVTSFAGSQDKRSGLEWGGVSATGVAGKLNYDDGDVGAYAKVGGYQLSGHEVKDNAKLELNAGFYKYLINEQDERLTVGLALTAMGFENNQNHFNYGSGGYFSPKTFFSLAMPVSWEKRGPRFSFALRGALGVQHIEQNASPYFMRHKALQQRLEEVAAAAAQVDWPVRTHTEASSDIGLGYSLSGAGEYKLGQQLFVGGEFGVNNAPDYLQWSGGMYLRYMLEPQRSLPMALPVRTMAPSY